MKYKVWIFILILITINIVLTGCATKKKFRELEKDYWTQQSVLDNYRLAGKEIETELGSLQQDYDKLKGMYVNLNKKLLAARLSIKEISEQDKECPEEMKKGLVYKVQIGAYERRELPEDLTQSINLYTEDKDNMQRIIVGQFRNYNKAKSLKEQLRAMGVGDAFIVAYIDNQRENLQEVLLSEGIKE